MVSKILIFKEKHGDRYFNADTDEARARAFYRILKERNTDGYWYYRNYESATLPLSAENASIMALTDEQIKALPVSVATDLKAKRTKLVRKAERYAEEKQEEDEWFDALDFLLKHSEDEAVSLTVKDAPGEWLGKGNLAETLISERSDYEYESFYTATVE